jgi:hypothetical protein
MANETQFAPAAAPTSAAELRSNLAAAEAEIQRIAAAERGKASILPEGVEAPTRESIADASEALHGRQLSVEEKHRVAQAQFADLADVVAAEQRAARGENVPGAAYTAKLQAWRAQQPARMSSAAATVFEHELAASLRGYDGSRGDNLPAFLQREGTPMSASDRATWNALVAEAKSDAARASVPQDVRDAGFVSVAELVPEDMAGYRLAVPADVYIDPMQARSMLSAARAAGMSQAQVDSAVRHMAAESLKGAGR